MQLTVVTERGRMLAEQEATIEANTRNFMAQAAAFEAIQEDELYKDDGYLSWSGYLLGRWSHLEGGGRYVRAIKAATAVVKNLGTIAPLPVTESQCRPLAGLPPEQQIEVWERVRRRAEGVQHVTAKLVTEERDIYLAELSASDRPDDGGLVPSGLYTVDAWNALDAGERRDIILNAPAASDTKFNRTNNMVEWALWTWNPVTGCEHGCDYCYARDIANRYYTELPEAMRFAPVFRPSRLHAPRRMRVPAAADQSIGERNVFVCSMADLFGKWVPQEWIDAVFSEAVAAPDWNFLFLTKFPQRLAEQAWPENAWCGTTVDRQTRVGTAERSFRGVQAGVKWLSCEPLLERLTFSSLEMFDWVVIGASSKSTQTPEFQPPWEWVEHLIRQAREAGCRVYVKPNLTSRPREYPGGL